MGKLNIVKPFILLVCVLGLSVTALAQADYEQQIQYIDSVNSLSFQYLTSSPDQALDILNQTRVMADSLGYMEGKAETLEKLSLVLSYLGDIDESVASRMESIQIFEELGMMLEAGYGFAELGYGTRRRDFERAEYLMNRGINLLEEFPQSTELANAYNNYGIVKLDQGQIDSAIYFVEKSLEIKETNNDTLGISYSLGYLGTAYMEAQNFEQAIYYLTNSYELKTQLKDSSGMAIDLTNIANSYQGNGNIEEAIENYRASLNMALVIKYQNLAEHNYNQLSGVFEEFGQYDSALYYQKLYSQFRQTRLDETTASRIAELEVQFETEEKEKDLALQRAEIASTQLQVRNRNWILAALGSFLLFGGIISVMRIRQQKIEQRENELKLKLAKAETENKIHQERERISRDLHDNVGAQITSLISGLEISNHYVKKNKTDDALNLIGTLDNNAREAMSELRETIWLLNKSEILVEDFVRHLQNYIDKHALTYGNLNIRVKNELNTDLELSAQQSLNMLRIIQEALSNCVKYASATQFDIHFKPIDNSIKLELKDNGKSIDTTSDSSFLNGNGIINMKRRAEDLSGKLNINHESNSGFNIEVLFPISSHTLN